MQINPPKILIADDDPGTIRMLTQTVKDLGKVYFTTQGSEVVALAVAKTPDLILLDVEMPDMNGLAVCEQIKSKPVCKDIPILFVTSHIDAGMETRALQAGALDFIHKPPHAQIVKARVRNYLALKRQADRLRMLSMMDGLTGVSNRRAFDLALADEWRRSCRNGQPLALLMLDVDYFKRYNDTYGHQAGDDCLRAVASAISAGVKRPGELAARYGGEEFAVLLPNCTGVQACGLAEIIRTEVLRLNIAHATSDVLPQVTISGGVGHVSVFHPVPAACGGEVDGTGTDTQPRGIPGMDGWDEPVGASEGQGDGGGAACLVKAADDALYRAKRKGRNCVEVSPS